MISGGTGLGFLGVRWLELTDSALIIEQENHSAYIGLSGHSQPEAGVDRASKSQRAACCQGQQAAPAPHLVDLQFRAGSLLPTAIYEQAGKHQKFQLYA